MNISPFRQLAALALCAPLLGGSLPLAQPGSMSGEDLQEIEEAFLKIRDAFEADAEARVPTEGLPEYLVSRLDHDQDGFITQEELEERRRESQGPQDRSDFTFLHEEGFPLNVDPQIVTADEADIGDDDIVMGVVINGVARAYPVNYMNGPYDEVVNDTLGGEAIASTW